MDWELYERYRATSLLVVLVLISFFLLAFQHTAFVRYLRSGLVVFTLPGERFLSGLKTSTPVDGQVTPTAAPVVLSTATAETPSLPSWGVSGEHQRALQALAHENARLRELLALRQRRWPSAVAAHVVGRDPQRWFQEIVLDKGGAHGIQIDDPVVAVVGGREGLVGRVTDVSERVSKVMLTQDPLSAVAATVLGASIEDGVAEGSNGHDLVLRYLDRSSQIKIGDPVVTSGLGGVFPDGIPIGWVADLSLDQRQLFLQARLQPAVRSNQLSVVMVLLRPVDRRPSP